MNIFEFVKNGINTICAKYMNDQDEVEYLPIFYIAGSQTLPPPLPPEEEAELIEKLSEEDNLAVRQKLVERNLRLVVYIAKKFENTGIGIEDLISIGTIGLMKGVNTFNSDITSRNLEDEVDKSLLRASISKLNDREKNIMEMRFGFQTGKEKTQKEVADELRNFAKLHITFREENY